MKKIHSSLWVRSLSRMLMLLVASIVVGTLLLVAVYSLPTERIRQNVKSSAYTLANEDVYQQVIDGYDSSRLDNYTDSLMLLNACIGNESGDTLQNAMLVPRYFRPDEKPHVTLNHYFIEQDTNYELFAYPRYWHGYLVFLKPLLMFVNLSQLRILNISFQLALYGWLVCLLAKRLGKPMAVAFWLTLLILSPVTIAMSLHYSAVGYLTMLSSCLMLQYDRWFAQSGRLPLLFFGIGIAVAYCDLFTYPLVALGLPLIIALALYPAENNVGGIKQLMVLCLAWGAGYGLMWASKWVLGSLILNVNVLNDALEQASTRTNGGMGLAERFVFIGQTLQKVMVHASGKILLVPALLAAAALVVALLKKKATLTVRKLQNRWAALILCALLPLVWYSVCTNHSYMHARFTYRELSISLFAFLSAVACMVECKGDPEVVRRH